jgi:uncharacterized membrane protein
MGKPKEKPKVVLPKAADVEMAKPFVAKLSKAKARLAKVVEKLGADAKASDPKRRAARKMVKRAQRRLRETIKYAASRPKKEAPAVAAPAADAAPAEVPAS